MQIVIDISEEDYEMIKTTFQSSEDRKYTIMMFRVLDSIKNGKPLPKGHNENNDYAECDQFVCSECGIELQDWHRVEHDIDDGDITYHEYTFRYCPNCGAIIKAEEG